MNTINITPEQIRAAAKTNLDEMIEIATAQFNAVEKIANARHAFHVLIGTLLSARTQDATTHAA